MQAVSSARAKQVSHVGFLLKPSIKKLFKLVWEFKCEIYWAIVAMFADYFSLQMPFYSISLRVIHIRLFPHFTIFKFYGI